MLGAWLFAKQDQRLAHEEARIRAGLSVLSASLDQPTTNVKLQQNLLSRAKTVLGLDSLHVIDSDFRRPMPEPPTLVPSEWLPLAGLLSLAVQSELPQLQWQRTSRLALRMDLFLVQPIAKTDESDGYLLLARRSFEDTSLINMEFSPALMWSLFLLFAGLFLGHFSYLYFVWQPILEVKENLGLAATKDKDLGRLRREVGEFRQIYTLIRRLQQMIRTESRRSQAIFASMMDGFIAVDNSLKVLEYNPIMAAMLRFDDHRAYLGERLEEVIRIPRLKEAVEDSLKEGEILELELEFTNSSEGKEYFQVHISPLELVQGGFGALIVFHDLTRVRRLEKVRTDFVSNVSHELKTPLTSMRGIIEMFEEKSLGSPEEADKFVAILSRQAKRLDSIINDLLVLSRLEDDEDKHIELICTQIRDAVDLSVQVCKERADLKNIALVCSIDPSLHGLIHPPLFEQALVNLIVNAINYSPEGTLVSITAFRQENLAVVMVKDQGIGIDPKHHARLWERFYRVDKSRHRGSGGTGLGLAIVKHIAMIHGGQIGIESMPGQGSTFKFSVNACHPEPQSEVLAIPGA